MDRTARDVLTPQMVDAVNRGAERTGPLSVHWNISGFCERPKYVAISGRPTRSDKASSRELYLETGSTLFMDYTVPCRRCPACLQSRRNLWTRRAMAETEFAMRTWFGTLTFKPEVHTELLALARHKYDKMSSDFDALQPHEKFQNYCWMASPRLTKWLKRVRKQSGVPLRYLLVAEPHKRKLEGFPHWHVLVHEMHPIMQVPKRILKDQWSANGFSRWKLCNSREHVHYVTKYLTKETTARIRASVRYGEIRPNDIVKIVNSFCADPNVGLRSTPKDFIDKQTGGGPEGGASLHKNLRVNPDPHPYTSISAKPKSPLTAVGSN